MDEGIKFFIGLDAHKDSTQRGGVRGGAGAGPVCWHRSVRT